MKPFDAIAMGVAIIGFFTVLAGFVAVLNWIISDVIRQFDQEREQRRFRGRCEAVSGRPEFFRPRHARNRWL